MWHLRAQRAGWFGPGAESGHKASAIMEQRSQGGLGVDISKGKKTVRRIWLGIVISISISAMGNTSWNPSSYGVEGMESGGGEKE